MSWCSCGICGYHISDYDNPNTVSWLNQFRTLYSSSTGIWFSGVGLYYESRRGIWIAPLDYAARWDDAGYDSPDHHRTGVMDQSFVNGRHGFVFHEACWSLLQKSWDPEGVPKRLLDVCKSLPLPRQGDCVSWGHDYGGLVVLDDQDRFPFEDWLTLRREREEQCLSAREDPYDVPAIQQLLKETTQDLSSGKEMDSLKPSAVREEIFTRLPPEICHMIATYLPTPDYLSLRQASRAFAPIFSSRQFWASRFGFGHDRYWLIEAWNRRESRDWKLLYHLTKETHIPSKIMNRKRVWNLIQLLNGLLSMRWSESSNLSLKPLNPDHIIWREMAGDVKPEPAAEAPQYFEEGCRLFYKCYALVPDSLSHIAFSIVRLGDVGYIAGMRLISSQGTHSCLGYQSQEKEVFLDATVLEGYNLAVSARGIQAVQAVTGENRVSPWIGCPDECPKTQFLAISRPVRALQAGFDSFKMVSLGIGVDIKSSGIELPQRRNMSLRGTALWYPKIPEPQLYLSGDYAADEDTSTVEYQPLFWILFGGIGGVHLRFVTGITVEWTERKTSGSLYTIEFHYTEEASVECPKLGRREAHRPTVARQRWTVTCFAIDGPGGEIIDSIDVYVAYSSNLPHRLPVHGVLRSLKISTNRGRSYHFGPQQGSEEEIVVKSLTIAPGTTITGLYASRHQGNHLTRLGAISEPIVENREKNEA